jgi:hypothetical protein
MAVDLTRRVAVDLVQDDARGLVRPEVRVAIDLPGQLRAGDNGRIIENCAVFCTSNCEYVFRETPAPEALLILTCGRPFAVPMTFGACAPEGTICASASTGASPHSTSTANAA